MKPVLSLNDLASRLGVPRDELSAVASEVDRHYRSWQKLYRKSGKVRTIHSPSRELKAIQRRITRHILIPIKICPNVHGGVKKCSPRTNATPHLRRKWLVNLDVRDFFPQIRHKIVLKLFRQELGFGRDVARLLTRLTTRDGGLPQGAPTSLALANLVLWKPVDVPVADEAAKLNINYTRWVDDISISGDDPRPIINEIAQRLSWRGLRMYRKKAKFHAQEKLKVTPKWERQEVTGLVVNGEQPTISRSRRDKIRAAIHQLKAFEGAAFLREVDSIEGRINHLRQFSTRLAERFWKELEVAKR